MNLLKFFNNCLEYNKVNILKKNRTWVTWVTWVTGAVSLFGLVLESVGIDLGDGMVAVAGPLIELCRFLR